MGSDESEDDFVPLAQLAKRKRTVPAKEECLDDSDSDNAPLSALKPKKKVKKTTSKASASAPAKKKKAKTTPKKKATPKAKGKSKVKVKAKVTTKKEKKPVVVRKLKVHGKAERLDMAIKAFRWWHAEELPEGIAWRKLEHNGVMFPPEYIRHNIPLLYDEKPVKLTSVQEEIASFYAAMPLDGPQLGGDAKTVKIFNKNFFKDFQAALGKDHVIQSFEKCNFDQIRQHLNEQRELKKNRTKEEKLPEKEQKIQEQYTNGFAMLDGHLEKIGNFRIEPPGLFRGRGEHPKTGTLKERVKPEQVTINIGMGDRVPPCSTPGHAWKEVIHRDSVTWLAYWNENVMGGTKYVWLAASSSFKGKSDMQKYEKARRLKKYIAKIRKDYRAGLQSKDKLIKQRSTAMWVIDILALRVGNEKGEDEADTVGCCSLRVEHMNFNDDGDCELTLSFLGKDSMPYNNTIQLAQYDDVGKQIYKNLKSFCDKKTAQEQVFDLLTPTELNKHLGSLMPGLSAKVFRTYNASITLEQELPYELDPKDDKKVLKYNEANRKVAILCNHQRTVPKSHESSMEKLTSQLELLETQLAELKEMIPQVQKNKTVRLKSDTTDPLEKKAESHLSKTQPTVLQLEKKRDSWEKKLGTLKVRVQDKEDNKEVALGTSKINYMDPRITVAWCKRNQVPISAVFAKTLREKFVWAMDSPPDWTF